MVASLAFLHGRARLPQHGRGRLQERPAGAGRRDAARRPLRPHWSSTRRSCSACSAGERRSPSTARYYHVNEPAADAARCRPSCSPACSSPARRDAGLAAARAIGATAVTLPASRPSEERRRRPSGERARRARRASSPATTAEEAWRVAHERFPEDRKGQLTHQLAMKVSDSHWHQQLSRARRGAAATRRAQPLLARAVQELQDLLPVPGRQLRHAWRASSPRYIAARLPARSSWTSRRAREELEHIGVVFDRGADAATAA